MAYLIPDTSPQPSRLIAAYDSPKRPLLDRGLSTSGSPDLTELRRYLAIRQRAEDMAAAQQAMSEGATGRRRWPFSRRDHREIADPQLRPITWAVPLRGDRRDLEDAHAHRGLEAHAYFVNSASTEPAVCGYKPRTRRAMGGGRVACLTPACLENNARCRNCLVLLYGPALSGEVDSGPWPSAESAAAEDISAVAAAETPAAGEASVLSEAHAADNDYLAEDKRTEAGSYLAFPPYGQPLVRDEEQAAAQEQIAAGAEHLAVPEAEPAGELEGAPSADAVYGQDLDDQLPAYPVASEAERAGVAEAAAEYTQESLEVTAEAGEATDAPEAVADAGEMPDETLSPEPVVIPIAEDWDAEHEEIVAAGQEVEVRLEEFSEVPIVPPTGGPGALDVVLDAGASDVLVVVAAGRTALIAGGIGRGTDWAGTVLDMDHESVLQGTLTSDYALQLDGEDPQRICGPYWARAATLVPVTESTAVIFGSEQPLELAEEVLLDAARAAAQRYQHPAPEVGLADERELAIAIQRIMDGAGLSFEATLDHVLSTTASVLGCSLAAGYARMGRRMAMRAMDLDGADDLDPQMLLGSGVPATGEERVLVEEEVGHERHLPAVVTRLRLPLKGASLQGMLVLTHTSRRPRGFTTQDQRVAEAIAPAAVLVLERAGFGEGMRTLESHLRSAPAADPLTGVANQAAWDEALASEADRLARYGGSAAVAAFKIDGLKRIDERQGPQARDAALRQAAELMRTVSRSTDLVARVSEDEFRILVRNAGHQGGRRLATRIRRAARNAQASEESLPPLAISWANARSRGQLLQASRLVGQRLRTRARLAEQQTRLGSGRPH